MELLDNPIRAYSWGSHTWIAALQGRPAPTEAPEAELWMGAHPDSPSTVRRGGAAVRLDEVLGADRLPFMLKVLAADRPLSLQAHPDSKTAARRYAEESGLPAQERLYTDPYAKPELLVAVEDFDTLCGFRDPSIAADVLDSLRVAELAPVVAALRTGSFATRLRTATDMLLHWPVGGRAAIVASVVAAARGTDIHYLADLGERFPSDMGVVVA
ncbi:MAG TPA: type I phosphomannose isomerase catalytic subunit, partial [Micromonosporaceae bacterium]